MFQTVAGHDKRDGASSRSGVPDVLAAGDCAEIVTHGDGRNLLQQVWYTGKRQARVAARVLRDGGGLRSGRGTTPPSSSTSSTIPTAR